MEQEGPWGGSEELLPKILAEFEANHASLGAIFILRKDIGVGGLSRKWQFFLTLCSETVLT